MRRKKLLWFGPLAIVAFAAFIAAGGWVVMQLWNWLTPALFGWKLITFWQALAMLVLCRLLFGGHWRGPRMGRRASEMTPEERERVRDRLRARCGAEPATGENQATG